MKNVLFVASECVPFVKTGGLADVVGSLPKYFDKNEFDVRVMVPKYACIPEEWKNKMNYVTHFYIDLAWRKQYVGIMEMEYEGVKFYFIDNEFYFSTINLSYRLDGQKCDWLKRVGISAATIGVYMEDICRFSSIKMERGIDYPFSRQVSMSLNVTF